MNTARAATMPPVKLTWHQGVNKPEIWKQGGIPQWDSGVPLHRRQGHAACRLRQAPAACRKSSSQDFKRPEPVDPELARPSRRMDRTPARPGEPTTCNFEYSGWLTEANHLGNVAYRVGKKLEWDPVDDECKNAPEADALLRREYRSGWKLKA